jgi:lipopolysaccharide biosynthesis glycosyltransferase
MNVLVVSSQEFLPMASVMASSLRRNTPSTTPIRIFVPQRPGQTLDLSLLIRALAPTDEIVPLQIGLGYPTSKSLDTLITLMGLRFQSLFCLPEDVGRILWLDSDIVVTKDISSYYFMDFGEKGIVAGTRDLDDGQSGHCKRLAIPDRTYLNAGAALINITNLRAKYTKENFFAAATNAPFQIVFPDQDMINYLFSFEKREKIIESDYRFDYYAGALDTARVYTKEEKQQFAIYHFIGPHKPWAKTYDAFNKNARIWWKYAKASPAKKYFKALRAKQLLCYPNYLYRRVRDKVRFLVRRRKQQSK